MTHCDVIIIVQVTSSYKLHQKGPDFLDYNLVLQSKTNFLLSIENKKLLN